MRKLTQLETSNVLRFVYLTFAFCIFSCQETEEVIQPIKHEDVQQIPLSIIGDMFLNLDVHQNGFDLKKLKTAFKDEHNIDFDSVLTVLKNDKLGSLIFLDQTEENINIQARIDPDDPNNPPVPPAPTTTTFYFHFDVALSRNVMSIEASNILKRLVNAIDAEKDTYDSQYEYRQRVKSRVATIRSSIASVKSTSERNALYKAVDTYTSNIDAVFKIVEKNFEKGSIAVRTSAFGWRKFLRKVRSVLISTAVGAYAGFKAGAIGGPAGAIAGAIIGGSVGLVGSVLDVAFNDRCHYALQCSNKWMQTCETGECWTKDDGTTGNYGQDPFVEHEVEGFSKVTPLNNENCKGCSATNHKITLDNIDAYPFESVYNNTLPFSTTGMIDMSKAPASSDKNELGWPRNARYFWKQYSDPFNALSPANKDAIKKFVEGKSTKGPIVDAQWIRNQPGEQSANIGEVIEHHHLNKGRYAIPRAYSLHRTKAWYKQLHPKIANSVAFTKRAKGMASHGKTIIGRLSMFYDIYSAVTASAEEDPLATHNIIYTDNGYAVTEPNSKFKAGRLYWRQRDDTFIYVISRSSTGMYYEIYESHGYDGYEKKYIGVGKILGPSLCSFTGPTIGRESATSE